VPELKHKSKRFRDAPKPANKPKSAK